MECELCFENFNETDHRPLVLIPCGHSYCSSCAAQLTNCPSDRKIISYKTDNWSILKLIPESELNKQIRKTKDNLSKLKELANEKSDENEHDLVKISINKSVIEKIEEKLKTASSVDEKIEIFNFHLFDSFNRKNSIRNFWQLIKEVNLIRKKNIKKSIKSCFS